MKQKILVVDDDQDILDVVRLILEDEGYDVRTSLNGACFQQMHNDLPNLIILDVLLSGEDGREICRSLKSSDQTRHIPVIMFSAHSSLGSVASGCGADEILNKPFDTDIMINTVKKKLLNLTVDR